jgi:hypothetical protein
MSQYIQRGKRYSFLLPYCIPLKGYRGGAATKKIKEAYSIKREPKCPYNYTIRIIASRERIFPIFASLSSYIGDPCMAILERHEENPPLVYTSFSCGMHKTMDTFNQYSFQLINDGFTAFGIASEELEVFVGVHKDISVYSNSSKLISKVMQEYDIQRRIRPKWLESKHHFHLPIDALFNVDLIREICEPIPQKELNSHNLNPKQYNTFFQTIVHDLGLDPIQEI